MPDTITKNARIFRSGTYVGKGANGADFIVTIDDLKRIAANTPEVPIIFAHDETRERLDFGKGTNLRVEGDELHATLNLDAEAAPFVEKNGLKSLSAGIPFDLSRLQEISFTRRPHILDMGTFSQDCAWFSLGDEIAEFSLTVAERAAIDQADCAGPDKSYPCDTREHLRAACRLYGKADDPAAVKAAIIRIARRKGWESELPADWGKAAMSLDTLFATFAMSRHNTPQGQCALQNIHDATAAAGAECSRSNIVRMSSAHENTAIQKIHDVTAAHGAKCAAINDHDGDEGVTARSMYSQSEQPADERKIKMGFWDRFLGKENATDAEKTEAKAEFTQAIKEAVPAPADTTAQFATMQKRIEAQDAELFANRMLSSGRILPTQVKDVIAEFSEAAEDDRLAPRIVTFSAGTENKQGTRVERVKAKYENAQPNRLTEELLPDGHYTALFNREHTGQTEEQKQAAREKEYQGVRAQTSLGPVVNNSKKN